MKKLLLTTTIIFAAGAAFADIAWQGQANAVLGPDDVAALDGGGGFNTPLQGNFSSSASGYFLQLLYAGNNGTIDEIPGQVASAADLENNFGARGDDQVVAVRWMGALSFATGANGFWRSPNALASDVPSGNYFVRAWAGVSREPAKVAGVQGDPTAMIPAPNNQNGIDFWWYGNSSVLTNPADPATGPAVQNTLDFTDTPFVAGSLVQVIPEPSTFALLGMGGALLFLRIRRRK